MPGHIYIWSRFDNDNSNLPTLVPSCHMHMFMMVLIACGNYITVTHILVHIVIAIAIKLCMLTVHGPFRTFLIISHNVIIIFAFSTIEHTYVTNNGHKYHMMQNLVDIIKYVCDLILENLPAIWLS